MAKQILAIVLLATACANSADSVSEGEIRPIDIAANTVACEGVAPMRCLIVNGELFYDEIDGYEHVEGQGSRICVIRSARPEPILADAGSLSYQLADCE